MDLASPDFWTQVVQLSSRIAELNYYQVLGVEPTDSLGTIRRAHATRLRHLHPDRHALERDPHRKAALTRLAARVGEAYKILSHSEKRRDYDQQLAQGQLRWRPSSPTPTPKNTKISGRSRDMLQRARNLATSDQVKAAIAQLKLALQLDPDCTALLDELAKLDVRGPKPSPPQPAQASGTSSVAGLPPTAVTPTTADHPTPIVVRCNDWTQVVTLFAKNLSEGEMFLRSAAPARVGTRVELDIETPDGQRLTMHAEVTATAAGERSGMAVRFIVLPATDRERFEKMLRGATQSQG